MSMYLRDNRLDDYVGNFDTTADNIAEQLAYEFVDIPSLEQIQNEILPKVKK